MIEKHDGSFGKIMHLDGMLRRFWEEGVPDEVKSIHFGTVEQLSEMIRVKENKRNFQEAVDDLKNNQQEQIDQLTKQVNRILIHLGLDDKTEILIVGKETLSRDQVELALGGDSQ